jgi:hypothetical protein
MTTRGQTRWSPRDARANIAGTSAVWLAISGALLPDIRKKDPEWPDENRKC